MKRTEEMFDGALLDHVFQPAADWLEVHGFSCFQVARVLLDGGLVIWPLGMWCLDAPFFVVASMGWSVALLLFRLTVQTTERHVSHRTGNYLRQTLVVPRIIGLLTVIIDLCVLTASWGNCLLFLGYVLWLSSAYFASCNRLPPQSQQVWQKIA